MTDALDLDDLIPATIDAYTLVTPHTVRAMPPGVGREAAEAWLEAVELDDAELLTEALLDLIGAGVIPNRRPRSRPTRYLHPAPRPRRPAVLAKGSPMDQDTFADLSANVARMSAELEQMRRDIAELAEAGRRIYQYLDLHDPVWRTSNHGDEPGAWVAGLDDIAQRSKLGTLVSRSGVVIHTSLGYAPGGASLDKPGDAVTYDASWMTRPLGAPPDGMPVLLWTRWNFDQESMVAPNRDGFACYSAWLRWDDAAMPVMAFADGNTYVCDREAARRDPDGIDAGTYWTGVPGHRRDHALEDAAERAGWRRQPNEGETDETY